ncbi:MAG: radical SAM protein [Candidatus Baltobacteraceae bacterium]
MKVAIERLFDYTYAMGGVQTIEVAAKSVLNRVAGMPFPWSINPYRGCYHQCVFCYARRSHSFLDEDGIKSWGSRIYAKVNAPQVLRAELRRKNRERDCVCIGTVTDPYQPLEGRYRLTRGILEALRDFEVPVGIITRSPLVIRDIDVLSAIARTANAHVSVSIATMDPSLAREIEPTVAPPQKRMLAVRKLAEAGISVSVALAPILPMINDDRESIEAVVTATREAGAQTLWHSTLNLREVTRDAFFKYLRAMQPQLLGDYERMYRKPYADRSITGPISHSVKAALLRQPLQPLPTIRRLPSGQLELSFL